MTPQVPSNEEFSRLLDAMSDAQFSRFLEKIWEECQPHPPSPELEVLFSAMVEIRRGSDMEPEAA